MSIFDGLDKAEVFGKGTYLSPGGEYIVKIDNLIHKNIRKGGEALIVELEVVSSTNEKDPVGAKRTWFQKKNDSFLGAVLEFLYAACGCDYKNDPEKAAIIKANAVKLMNESLAGGLNGRTVRVTTGHKLTAAAQKDFTTHVWGVAPAA